MLKLWDTRTSECVGSINCEDDDVTERKFGMCMALAPLYCAASQGDPLLAVGSEGGEVCMLSLKQRKKVAAVQAAKDTGTRNLCSLTRFCMCLICHRTAILNSKSAITLCAAHTRCSCSDREHRDSRVFRLQISGDRRFLPE